MVHGRRRPYSATGIRRLPCVRCGAKAHASWNVCADGNLHRPICRACDVALNELAMRFVFGDTREADLAAYRARVLG